MFVDASVVVAIINREDGFQEIVKRMEAHRGKFDVSPLVKFEAVAAIARSRSGKTRPTPDQFRAASDVVEAFFNSIKAHNITITPTIGDKALGAAARFGKFVGHNLLDIKPILILAIVFPTLARKLTAAPCSTKVLILPRPI